MNQDAPSHPRETLWVSLGVLALAIVFWLQNPAFRYPDSVFPLGVIVLAGLLSIVNGARAVMAWRRANRAMSAPTARERLISPLAIGLGATVVLFASIFVFGFYVCTACFLFGMYAFVGDRETRWTRRNLIVSAVASIGVAAALYVVFTRLLGVQPPISLISRGG